MVWQFQIALLAFDVILGNQEGFQEFFIYIIYITTLHPMMTQIGLYHSCSFYLHDRFLRQVRLRMHDWLKVTWANNLTTASFWL